MLVLLTTADVVMRYFFNSPIKGVYEITKLTMLAIVALGIGYTQYRKGHIVIDVFTMRYSWRARSISSIISYILCLGIYAVITWQAVAGGRVQQERDVIISEVIRVPTYPFYYVLAAGCAVLCLVYIADIAAIVSSINKRKMG